MSIKYLIAMCHEAREHFGSFVPDDDFYATYNAGGPL